MDLNIVFFIVVFCYLWFDTDGFLEYAELLKLKFTKYKQFKEFKNSALSFSYHNYLLANHNCFFVRLITCPICLIVWLNLFALVFTPEFNLCGNIIFSWIGYFGLQKAIKKLNE